MRNIVPIIAVAALASAGFASTDPSVATTNAPAQANEVEKYDLRMALANASVDTNGVKWIDGRCLPLEGKCFDDVEAFYDRLPKNVTTNVNAGVRSLKHHSSGLQFRFRTDSKTLDFRWIPYSGSLAMDHMPATGVSGIDIYRMDGGKWRYVQTGRIRDAANGGCVRVWWKPGTPCLVNLPLYNGIKSFSLGIEKDATVEPLPPRKSGIGKPVVNTSRRSTRAATCSTVSGTCASTKPRAAPAARSRGTTRGSSATSARSVRTCRSSWPSSATCS